MIGKQAPQRDLFDVGNVYPFSPDPKTFYGQMAKISDRLFRDDEFTELYSDGMGRPSVSPSQLALTLLLQFYAGASDAEAVERTACDLRWAAVLRRFAGEPLCAKSTLCLFRAHLILHDKIGMVFERSISEARRAGLLPKALRVAIDTKPILGRGAVEDTYNLLAAGVRQLATALARAERIKPEGFFKREKLTRYQAPSVKGTEDINWSDRAARDAFLTGIVADCDKLLRMASHWLAQEPKTVARRADDERVRVAAKLLEQILLQDVDRKPDDGNATIRVGVAHGRVPSATDPEQRHGRKSASKRFTGAKASVVTDTQSGIILETDVIAADAPDSTGALDLVEAAEQSARTPVIETLGDCAYGSGETRQAFADAGRALSVRVPEPGRRDGLFTKSEFKINLEDNTVTCPGGITTKRFRREPDGRRAFTFGKSCAGCLLKALCTTSKDGRTVDVHPQETLLQEALARQKEPDWRLLIRQRLAVENSLGRLAWYGVGKARYIGHEKTRFQLKISATVANLRRVGNYLMAKEQNQSLATAV